MAFLVFSSFKKTTPNYDILYLRKVYSSGDKTQWPEPFLHDSIKNLGTFQDIDTLAKVKFPKENPYSKAKEELGKTLFFDPRLSVSGQISCQSCHDSELGWGDGRQNSYGHNRQLGTRNAMTLLNVGLAETLFWDGRSSSLEEQIPMPVKDTLEMNFHIDLATKRIAKIKGYQPLFEKAYGSKKVNKEKIIKAIATYERTIRGRISRFDKFIKGDSTIFTDAEIKGLHLFRTKARCINCHNTGYFSDNQFHNTGLNYYGRPFQDLGRFEFTKNPNDVGRFKTSTLREIGRTQPYMHNGFFPNLEGVINMYNAGMFQPKRKKYQQYDMLFPTTTPLVQKLHLTKKEKEDLEAFLGTLTTPMYRVRPPKIPM